MEYYCFQVSAPAHHRHFTSEKQKHHPTDTVTDDFIVDDLLVFPTDDDDFVAEVGGTSTDSSITAAVDSSNSSSHCGGADHSLARDGGCRHLVDNDNQFSNLCTPYDDLAEFEWMSDFIDESFSNEDVQKLQLLSGLKARPETTNPIFSHGTTIPVKPRTKRARATSVHWTSPLAVMLQNSKPETVSKKRKKTPLKNTNDNDDNNIDDDKLYSRNEEGRMCLHCGSKKTPQWRTGPMGPRTLCNACGVRYKSGRLVPEYRPAASPTFVVTKHSNSHRKVLELRRQKMHNQFMNHDDVMLGMANAGGYYNLIRQL